LSNALELSNFGATCLESFRSVAAAIEFGGIPSRRSYACWSESTKARVEASSHPDRLLTSPCIQAKNDLDRLEMVRSIFKHEI